MLLHVGRITYQKVPQVPLSEKEETIHHHLTVAALGHFSIIAKVLTGNRNITLTIIIRDSKQVVMHKPVSPLVVQ